MKVGSPKRITSIQKTIMRKIKKEPILEKNVYSSRRTTNYRKGTDFFSVIKYTIGFRHSPLELIFGG